MDLVEVVLGGLEALIDYIAYHVLTCLIPAFLLAGAIVSFLSRDVIIRYLGVESRKYISFPLASVTGTFIAACSCTVIPIVSGLYKKGSSIGPAFIILWVTPAANILALTYTGAILGLDMAIMRFISAILTAAIVGLTMVSIFRREELTRSSKTSSLVVKSKVIESRSLILIILLAITLLAPNYLGGLSIHKLLPESIYLGNPYIFKIEVFLILLIATLIYAYKLFSRDEIYSWLHESLWFVKMIFPLLLVGVFIVGVIGKLLPREVIESYLGGSSILSCFLATLIGALSYFATMTEAPFVKMLTSLGMGRGPALGLLLAGPGESLPNWLAIVKVFGLRRATVYVLVTIAISTATAYIAGNTIWR
ncbi:MAG: permease [Candidatus Methanomethylicia archaeon]